MSTGPSSSVILLDPPPDLSRSAGPAIVLRPIADAHASSAADEAAPRAKTKRDPDLDACRVLACLGVVWVHSAQVLPSGVGRFAVPMFTIMSIVFCALALRKRPDVSSPAFIAGRFAKLYPAFLFWCLAYIVLGQAKKLLTGDWSAVNFHWLDLIGGTQEHLWFLPFLLAGTCLAVPLLRAATRHRGARLGIGWAATICAIAWAATPIPGFVHHASPMSPWYWLVHAYWAMPSLFMAIALGCLAIARGDGIRVPRWLGPIGVALFAFGSYLNWSVAYEPILIGTTCAGVGVFWIAGSGLLPRGPVERLAPIGAFGMGVYLCHPMVLHACKLVAEKLNLAPSPATDVGRFVVALTCAFAMAWLLGRRRWTRWTIGV
jgi:peptidoglycan/LPS O-acetylase OafA/YrhL